MKGDLMTQVSWINSAKIKNCPYRNPQSNPIKDGKTDEETSLLEEIIPTILKIKQKELPLADFMEHLLFGQRIFRNENKRSSNYQRKY